MITPYAVWHDSGNTCLMKKETIKQGRVKHRITAAEREVLIYEHNTKVLIRRETWQQIGVMILAGFLHEVTSC